MPFSVSFSDSFGFALEIAIPPWNPSDINLFENSFRKEILKNIALEISELMADRISSKIFVEAAYEIFKKYLNGITKRFGPAV